MLQIDVRNTQCTAAQAFVKASKPLLIMSGLLPTYVEALEEFVLKEIETSSVGESPRMCGRIRSVWARKKIEMG